MTFETLKHSAQFLRLFYYSLYSLLVVFFYYCLNSVVVFIHFTLNQRFSVIDSWVERHNFFLTTFSKIISFIVVMKLVNIYGLDKRSVKDVLRKSILKPSLYSVSSVAFLWFVFLVIFRPSLAWTESTVVDSTMIWNSIWGSFLFYLTDILLLMVIRDVVREKEKREKWRINLIYLLIFFATTMFITPYRTQTYLSTFLNYLMLLFFLWKDNKNMGDLLFYIILIIIPVNAIFGMNIFWDHSFTPFEFQNISVGKTLFVWCIAYFYIAIKESRTHLIK